MHSAKKIISGSLSPFYSSREIESITRLIFEKVLGLSRLQIHLHPQITITEANLVQIKEILNRLMQFEPIQYILGATEFYGLIFKVTPAVLIPRPETEELVDWIISDYKNISPTILDIGTGSGCIPISLMKNLPEATAEAWDISEDALSVATENASNNQVKINFRQVDVLNPMLSSETKKFDIIISNPPYVTNSEQSAMLKNVTDHEPQIALFVSDSDPLVFYRAIARIALTKLKRGGNLYFEINEKFSSETVHLLDIMGFKQIQIKKDINSKERMIKTLLP